jgi:hypothetical protein
MCMKSFRRLFRGLVVVLFLTVSLVQAQVSINEFLASNSRGLIDSDGDRPDWIELFNSSGAAVSLQGWSLTDEPAAPRKWIFPAVQIPANGYLVVLASGKNRTNAAAALHTSFSLSIDGEYLALFPPESGVAATEFAPTYPPQRADISYGVRSGRRYYFSPPSPGVGNTGGIDDFVGDTKFNRDRGVYDAPFDLQITCATPGAVIRYTTNGAPPTLTSGFTYSAPVRIDRTVVIRAAAFKTGLQPSDVDTQTYLFMGDVIRQQPAGQIPWAGWPVPGSQSQDYDYGMDPRIVDSPIYRDQIVPALKALPTMSMVTTLSNLFDGANGIFSNPGQDGRPWERPASLELIHPDGTKGFQINCGIRIRGGFSRSPGNPKHAFRFFFREEYGEGKLKYPLHAGGVEEFDALDLRTFQNYSWSFDPGGGANGVFIRDVFSRDTQLAMGQQGERGNYYHLFINGVYWGIFNSCERPEANYGEAYFGGRAEDYDVVKVEAGPYAINATDGNLQAWTRLYNLCRAITVSNADTTFWRVQGRNPDGSRNPAYENLLEIDNLIDYMLVIVFGGNLDAPISNFLGNTRPNNWYGLRDRSGTNGGFRFISHDAEHTLLDVNQNRVGPFSSGSDSVLYSNPQYLWQQLWNSPEFKIRIADRVQRHFFNGGALTVEAAQSRFAVRTNQLYSPVVAESARWGDSKQSTPLTRDVHWLGAANQILNSYLPVRGGIVLGQMRSAGLLPAIDAPTFSRFGGIVTNGFNLVIKGSAGGSIVYTLNGADPRAPGGIEDRGARPYNGPIPITGAVRVKARIHRVTQTANEWSALTEAVFHVAQDFSGLQLSEIHYHPADPIPPGVFGGDEFEFLEFKNAGTSELDLSGLRISNGVEYEFPLGTRLAPGRFLILAENAQAFGQRYPTVVPDGIYAGQLSNSGERLTLVDPAGATLLTVGYGTELPWPTTPDGAGFSLVPRDPVRNPAPDLAGSWRASSRVAGSPGADDPPSGVVPVVVNEVLAHTDPPALDAVELYNPGSVDAPIGGWFLTDDLSRPRKYRVPSGTVIPAGGYWVIDEAQFNAPAQGTNAFRFSSTGDEVFLFSAAEDGLLSGYSDGGTFGASFNGVSFVRLTNTVGQISLVPAVSPSFGAANSAVRLGPVVLQEIHYAPAQGEAPFVELVNMSSDPQPLFDPENPSNTWRLAGLDFAFPPGVILPSGGYAVVTEMDAAQFRQLTGLPASVPVFGPTPGQLQRNGERLELLQPDRPNLETNNGIVRTVVPYVTVDAVRYNDREPWPVIASLGGVPLERRVPFQFGDDPAAWRAGLSGPSPGAAAAGNRPPRVQAGPDIELTAVAFPLPVTLSGAAVDDGLPEPFALGLVWSQLSGPRGVVFRDASRSNGVVELPGTGTYVLRFTASDGEREVSDDVRVTVVRGGSDATLVPFGSTWRYFDQLQDLGTAWRARTFNDTAWVSGRARLGYGGDGEVTLINGGPSSDRNRTAYFRHRFNVANAKAVVSLVGRIIRDDGAVVYLNGQEVFRVSMPEGDINFQTFASDVIGGADETTAVERAIPASLLVDGDNVLAIEVHQVNSGSSDLGLDFSLSGVVQTANQGPTVEAGPGLSVTLPGQVILRAVFTDDGLPVPPGVPTFSWTKVSGPGSVTFTDGDSPLAKAAFSLPGTYVLRFDVSDGVLSAADTVTVVALPGAVESPVLQWVSRDPIGLRFAAQEGVAYQVRFRADLLGGAWQLLQAIPSGPARVVDVTDAPVEAQRFYQVIVP